MPYSCKDDYITFLLNLIDEFQASIPQTKQPGHPFDIPLVMKIVT